MKAMINDLIFEKACTDGPIADLSFGVGALELLAIIGKAVRIIRGDDHAWHRAALQTFTPTIRILEKLIESEPQEFSADERKAFRAAIDYLRKGWTD